MAVTRVSVKAVFLWAVLTARLAGTTAKSNRAAHTPLCSCSRLSQGWLRRARWVKCSPRVTRRQYTCTTIICLLRKQPLFTLPPPPSKKKPSWVCLSLKHRALTDWDLSSSPPSLNICFGPGPSEHKESVPSWADVSYKELHKRQCGELISVPRRQRTRRSQRRGRLVRTKTSRKRPTHRTAPWSFLSVSSTAALYSVPATCQGSHT